MVAPTEATDLFAASLEFGLRVNGKFEQSKSLIRELHSDGQVCDTDPTFCKDAQAFAEVLSIVQLDVIPAAFRRKLADHDTRGHLQFILMSAEMAKQGGHYAAPIQTIIDACRRFNTLWEESGKQPERMAV